LGLLLNVLPRDILELYREIEIFVAPAGTRTFNIPIITEKELLRAGFVKTKVGIAPERPHNFWRHGMKAKRRQYALKHHVASTIHSAIGHTVSKLATELGKENSVWERAMVVVLISRVRRARDLIFVGDPEANIEALIEGLESRNQYDEYMDHVVDVLTGVAGAMMPLQLNMHPFRYKDIALPQDRSGVVYMLVSIQDTSSMYIGQSTNVEMRLNQHNSGIGARETADKEKRPWGLYAYITGFSGDKHLLLAVEGRWQRAVKELKPDNPRAGVRIAQRLINRHYSIHEFQMVVAD
jgi:predicted GIY-YIG superfamily endonuclease